MESTVLDPVSLSGVLLRQLRGRWRFLETGTVRRRGEGGEANVAVTAGEPGREEGETGEQKKKNFATTKNSEDSRFMKISVMS